MQNKTLAGVVLAALILVGIVGYIVLAIADRDATAFSTWILTLVPIIVVALGLQGGLHKIEKQTNGALTSRDERISVLEAENTALRQQYVVETGTVPVVEGPPLPEVHPRP